MQNFNFCLTDLLTFTNESMPPDFFHPIFFTFSLFLINYIFVKGSKSKEKEKRITVM
tara:strand:- start:214 stop:384 length:171 start_codon:yes stop_codon:yes gene_type:complete